MAEEDRLQKFPRTRHLFDAGGDAVSRDDLLYTQQEAQQLFLSGQHPVAVEEKVDGANIGFSIAEDGRVLAQNRSHFVNSASHPQFKQLDTWISQHIGELYDILEEPGRFILFGEWLFAKHTVEYTQLPDYFLAFDIFDCRAGRFLSRASFRRRVTPTSIHCVPTIAEVQLRSKDDVVALLDTQSQFGPGKVEGVYLRVDEDHLPRPAQDQANQQQEGLAADANATTYLAYRAKVVRPDFLQGITHHWMGKELVRNTIKYS